MITEQTLKEIFNAWNEAREFSGVFSVTDSSGVIFQQACGYRNRAEELPNTPDTAFAIASGTKLFTALSVCKLIDEGRLKIDDRIWDILPQDLKKIDKEVTVFHLLTHTSGIGDYIDEEEIEDSFDILKLYENRPVHKWTSLEFYLPMINELPPKFKPGERVGYSNAGFILLGLVIEGISEKNYQQYVTDNLILPLNLKHTGFYRMNNLPYNTAYGYIFDEAQQEYITNTLYMPIMGGSDGGLFTCASDIDTLWRAVLSDKIISEKMRKQFFTPHGDFGLGVYLDDKDGKKIYYTVGGDFGVDFVSAYLPYADIVVSVFGNSELNTFPLLENIIEAMI